MVRTAYFYKSCPIFAAKKIVTESVRRVRSFMRIILASLDREKCGLEKGV